MEHARFTRKKEDFICEHCGASVTGDGYTNHCPECLYSKHVDINPGDRSALCGGLMKPMSAVHETDGYSLIHQCKVCGAKRKNKASPHDDFESIVRL